LLGAGGSLGALVKQQLDARGHHVIAVRRASARDPDAISRSNPRLIIDCAGGSLALGLGHGWRGYGAVDAPIGLAAAEAARRSGARLVYIAVHHPPAMRGTPYIAAHERVVSAMNDIDGCVVRATGFFSAFRGFLPFARRGVLFDVGRGGTRTNPIDERDLAEIVVETALDPRGPREVSAGGPEVLTRRQIFEQIVAAAGRRVRTIRVPVWLARGGSTLISPIHPRISQLARFACGLAEHDVIAPALGTRRLADSLNSSAGGADGAAPSAA
jgi:uncharacterized protein YbjT (DUF2867 family)